ncbi:hypothetical protein A2630_03350 [Candidatus Woesebacteria bacterium RIFCSPHIGHO2_01_FULL_44_10]|uniref:Prepilin peptidase n=1 Tax=Candidatus Woesebacteria bacterium RIFCSPLOWO2_01_FULL_44_14 TaxID=1802525 RepID=A0A1F8BZX0_9BACT|nr:MAG: hypothetical protein A2630_03350 [Candidatus Woesebacteria bacterium RIFCSPHIGHO2_01_FULL_44_10]OGM56446.1 MAG: hypothetical protein A3F62_02010 [Candidatus Woesebacteria bacterium RIFCSPHIGHO2_12_FULL_44_11]OGM68848.1 MAG: hypothetical protein A2975_00555 [Candidatus Woesebacteria bacterium RIFCSPLOWO2_01_FULL_44_14]
MLIWLVALGLAVGSFLGALTWRLPRGQKITAGRSVCPHCRHKITWYHNIPVFSYLVLQGKCSYCKKKISVRYPLIEIGTALVFMALGWRFGLSLDLVFYLIVASVALAVLVIDFEHQIIPDSLVFVGLAVGLTRFSYAFVLAGFLAATFLLLTNLVTRGRGMGLGDVKLALFLGTVLGPKLTVVWLMISFITGALVGLALIIFGKTSFGKKIAFGPFLVIGFFVTVLVGSV